MGAAIAFLLSLRDARRRGVRRSRSGCIQCATSVGGSRVIVAAGVLAALAARGWCRRWPPLAGRCRARRRDGRRVYVGLLWASGFLRASPNATFAARAQHRVPRAGRPIRRGDAAREWIRNARASALSAGLAVVLASALALRLSGLGFGLPAVYNPDEVAIMNRAVALGQNGLNPGNFLYPVALLLRAVRVGRLVVPRSAARPAVFGSLADFERSYFVDPTSIYLAGRLLSVVLRRGDRVGHLAARHASVRRDGGPRRGGPAGRRAAGGARRALRQARRPRDAARSCWRTSRSRLGVADHARRAAVARRGRRWPDWPCRRTTTRCSSSCRSSLRSLSLPMDDRANRAARD